MSVIPLTLIISLCLVATFLLFFVREQANRRFTSAEREALLPLAEEAPHVVHDSCGCREGTRPPCAGCLKAHPSAH